MTRNPIKNPAFPLLVGLDHFDNSLIPKAGEIVEQFGKKGKTLFVEMPSDQPLLKPSDFGCCPFDAAVTAAAEKGMTVIRLDLPRISRIARSLNKFPRLRGTKYYKSIRSYVIFDVRERQWVRTIRKQAKAGDIVMMHPIHLARVLRELHSFGFGKNVLFVSKVTDTPALRRRMWRTLSTEQINELKKSRAARRPINLRKKK